MLHFNCQLEAEKQHAEMLQRKKDMEEQERLKKIAEERQREKERLLELEKEREIEAEKLRLAEEERKREWQKKKEERFDIALDQGMDMGLGARKPDFIVWEQQRCRSACPSAQSDWYLCFYAPAICNGGGAYSITLVHTYIRTSVPYVLSRTYEKWFPGDIFWIHRCIGFIFHTQVYNHKIQVKFDYG